MVSLTQGLKLKDYLKTLKNNFKTLELYYLFTQDNNKTLKTLELT